MSGPRRSSPRSSRPPLPGQARTQRASAAAVRTALDWSCNNRRRNFDALNSDVARARPGTLEDAAARCAARQATRPRATCRLTTHFFLAVAAAVEKTGSNSDRSAEAITRHRQARARSSALSLAASSRNGVENPGPRCSRRAAAISGMGIGGPRSVCTSDRTSRQSEMIDPRRSSARIAPPKRRPRGSRRTVARRCASEAVA